MGRFHPRPRNFVLGCQHEPPTAAAVRKHTPAAAETLETADAATY